MTFEEHCEAYFEDAEEDMDLGVMRLGHIAHEMGIELKDAYERFLKYYDEHFMQAHAAPPVASSAKPA